MKIIKILQISLLFTLFLSACTDESSERSGWVTPDGFIQYEPDDSDIVWDLRGVDIGNGHKAYIGFCRSIDMSNPSIKGENLYYRIGIEHSASKVTKARLYLKLDDLVPKIKDLDLKKLITINDGSAVFHVTKSDIKYNFPKN